MDAYFIGPNDLAYSVIGQRSARTAEVLDQVERLCVQLKGAGKRCGMPADWSQLQAFRQSSATLLYFPIEWLLTKAVKDLSVALVSEET